MTIIFLVKNFLLIYDTQSRKYDFFTMTNGRTFKNSKKVHLAKIGFILD